jgi:hypothetical protein
MKATILRNFRLVILLVCGAGPLYAADPNFEGEPPETVASPAPLRSKSPFVRGYTSWYSSVYRPVRRIRKWVYDLYHQRPKFNWATAVDLGQQSSEKLKSCLVIIEGYRPKDPRIVEAHRLLHEQVDLDIAYETDKLVAARAHNAARYRAVQKRYRAPRAEKTRTRMNGLKELEKAARNDKG